MLAFPRFFMGIVGGVDDAEPMGAPKNITCSVYIATSVDGYIARPDDALDWLARVQCPDDDYGYKEFFQSVDVLVMGRRTYEVALGFEPWPYEGKRCVIMTRRGTNVARHGEEFTSKSPSELVHTLAAEGARHLYIDGGSLIRAFLEAGLVDNLVLSIVPVVLGAGIPLWSQTGREVGLHLESSRSWSTGLVQNRYRVQRPAD